MSPRSYEMVERAKAVAQTRTAILEAAAELLAGERYTEVSLGDVADAADVSRGTVYHQFGSRHGLIEALTTATEEQAGFAHVLAAADGDEPAQALVATCVELVRFVHETAPLFDNLRSLAQVDADLQAMVQRKDAARRDLMDRLTSSVARAGGLQVPRGRARAVVTALTSYEALREILTSSPSLSQAQSHIRWTIERLLHMVADDPPDLSRSKDEGQKRGS